MRNTYQIVTRVNGKEDQAEILAIIRDIKYGKKKNDLKLLNYYHEIPVSYAATIDSIDNDCIEATVHQAQAAVLGLQKQTIIKSANFPDGLAVHCYVEYISVRNCFSVLGRFAFATVRAERRNAVRVDIAVMIKADFVSAGQQIPGQLEDISLTGLALSAFNPLPSGIDSNGVINIVIAGNNITVKAELLRSKEMDHGYLHMFKIELEPQMEIIVSQFIYSRQVEIIRELKEKFEL